MKDIINLKIITLEGIFFSGEILEIILPTDLGQIAVLPNHIPLISKVKEGDVTLKTKDGDKKVIVSEGVLEVRPHSEVYLLVDKAS